MCKGVCSIAQSRPTLCDPMDCSQAPLPMGFSRQEYWSGFPFLSPGDRPNPGTEPRSPAFQADSLLSESPGKLLTGLPTSFIWKIKISSAYWTSCIFQRKYERQRPYWQVILTLVASLKWIKFWLRVIKGTTLDNNTCFLHRPQKYPRDHLHKQS